MKLPQYRLTSKRISFGEVRGPNAFRSTAYISQDPHQSDVSHSRHVAKTPSQYTSHTPMRTNVTLSSLIQNGESVPQLSDTFPSFSPDSIQPDQSSSSSSPLKTPYPHTHTSVGLDHSSLSHRHIGTPVPTESPFRVTDFRTPRPYQRVSIQAPPPQEKPRVELRLPRSQIKLLKTAYERLDLFGVTRSLAGTNVEKRKGLCSVAVQLEEAGLQVYRPDMSLQI
eukprot:Blabericola_migrator_1__4077@NODE_2240_length_3069_cov_93_188208_g1411_i0_p1_GENE_NODE_2240_length_3069_cov_93_188208_g1411_i0NODE_2240_length_3069_cov_93_188208_g1411_i0_p1_ORF_typecomplete_len224_score33_73KAR9/PF08580_10/9_2_NODE_2240_length_3069_cov_93_188208_g1411_i05371208